MLKHRTSKYILIHFPKAKGMEERRAVCLNLLCIGSQQESMPYL